MNIRIQRDHTDFGSFIASRIGRKSVRRPLPRMRLSIRLMMIGVAIAAVVCHQVLDRRNRFLRLAASHEAQIAGYLVSTSGPASGRNSLGRSVSEGESTWHQAMAQRYRAAAKKPWIPLGSYPQLSAFEAETDPFKLEMMLRSANQSLK